MRKYSSNLAFVDMLFNLLVGFTSLFIIAFLLINPIAEEGKVDPVTQFMITMKWEDQSEVDFDLWVKGPNGAVSSYQAKDQRYMVLERDDLGLTNDRYIVNGESRVVRRNQENLVINDIVPGEYIVNVHFFGPQRMINEPPQTVEIEILDIHPFRVVFTGEVTLTIRQEYTFLSFIVDEDGNVRDMNDEVQIFIRDEHNVHDTP